MVDSVLSCPDLLMVLLCISPFTEHLAAATTELDEVLLGKGPAGSGLAIGSLLLGLWTMDDVSTWVT